ncbi:hypothetical protein C8J57DRAFT_1732011 [Mycena rebaudengoi]|nr:hypothetical protein C8J57DRAFT_1732011 [Mycena rebaudengoi]
MKFLFHVGVLGLNIGVLLTTCAAAVSGIASRAAENLDAINVARQANVAPIGAISGLGTPGD